MRSPMRTESLAVSFTTPAFLGNAEQGAQWRTPPFKALFRQWWRVAWAAAHRASPNDGLIARMREEEGEWFGNAWLQDAHRKSSLLIRLSAWGPGGLTQGNWPTDIGDVPTSEKTWLGSDQYLGYGPLGREKNPRGKYITKVSRPAIQPGETDLTLALRFPDAFPHIDETLMLAGLFGGIGSRSRNGWGSLHLERPPGAALADPRRAPELARRISRPLSDCLRHDWGIAIATDDRGPMVWISRERHGNWKKTLWLAARSRVAARTAAKQVRPEGTSGAGLAGIYYLGYPAGTGDKKNKNPWRLFDQDNQRFASPLRLKVVRDAEGTRLLAWAMPCMLPHEGFLKGIKDSTCRQWLSEPENARATWEAVARALDDRQLGMQRIDEHS